MSEEKAQQWLQKYPQLIPALAHNQHEIVRLLDSYQHSQQVVNIAITDPGLCLAVLIKVNSKRGSGTSKDIVESPKAAIALMGEQVTHTLFKDFSVAESRFQDPDQLFLFRQLINRSLHNETQAEHWASQLGYQNLELIKVSALLSYLGELLCCVHDFENYRQYILSGSKESLCEQTFGFGFSELTALVCSISNLPSLISYALPHTQDEGQSASLLHFSAQLCQQCEHSWYSNEMEQLFQQFSEWSQLPVDTVVSKTHEFSIEAARKTLVADAWQPASRLILIQDHVWQALTSQQLVAKPVACESKKQEPVEQPKQSFEEVLNTIKRLMQQPGSTQSEVLNTCLKSLIQDIGMSRVSLLLLTKDKKSLHNRMSIGIDKNSPLNQFNIKLDQSGLLKILLNKPQAIWINKDSLKKYQKLIPPGLIASVMTDNFLAMSLFNAEKPLGIVYADRSNTTEPLNPDIFAQFKKLVAFTSKALTLISKR